MTDYITKTKQYRDHCDYCGTEYSTMPYFHQGTRQAFCSIDCMITELEAEGVLTETKRSKKNVLQQLPNGQSDLLFSL